MKKLLSFTALFIIVSCGTQKKVIVDPYVGIYDVTIFDVPQVGDWPLKLIIKKDDNGYAAELQTNSEDPAASEYLWEVTSTSVDDNMVYIDATIAAYNLNFELSIDEDDISGSMMGMFDVEGIRVK
tara:strand:+ start:1537 stop:1914 length:378 start_codon:yes stop_codon:yes gene_type:complete